MSGVRYQLVQTNGEQIDARKGVISGQPNIEIQTKNSGTDTGIMQKSITIFILIKVYFTLSIGLTFYQRRILADIKFPLTIALYHFILKFFLSLIIRMIYRYWTGRSRILLNFRPWIQKLGPTGLASGLDIGFSNWGLELVNISLYTMTKSTAIIFILIFAIILKLEKSSWSLAIIVVMISGGLFLVTYKSTAFDALGFCILLFASLSSGIRWSLAQLIMQKSKIGLHNPIDMVFHMQPWMALAIIPFSLFFESGRIYEGWSSLSMLSNNVITWWIIKISCGAVIAFTMELSEFLLVAKTSSLTLSITGIFKEICQIVLAVLINGDTMSLINVCGLLFCISGIICHVLHKYREYLTETNKTDVGTVAFKKNRVGEDTHTSLEQQEIPLLNTEELGVSDSDDSHTENKNGSDIIFDVLKSRDTRR